jgi:ubiquinone/menaquinone biosynthesis C-methylase UbiE
MEQNKENEKVFFDQFGISLDYDVFTDEGYHRIITEFVRRIDTQKPLKIIDFGCGTGSFTARFSKFQLFELHGIDISPKCIEYARNKYTNIHFTSGDVENTPFENEAYDVVMMSGLLHHFPDFSKVVKEAHRVLKNGGVVLAYDPHKLNPFMWLYRAKESPFYSSKGVTENEHPLKKSEILHVFKALPFSELEVYSISGIGYKYIESSLAQKILPVYNAIENVFDCPNLRGLIGSFVITYARK